MSEEKTLSRRGAFIKWAEIRCSGDEELGIPQYRKKIQIGINVEDTLDRENFRKGLMGAYQNVLGSECVVVFDFDSENQIKEGEINWGSHDEQEPSIS